MPPRCAAVHDAFDSVTDAPDDALVRAIQLAGEIPRCGEALVIAATDAVQERSSGGRHERLTARPGCRSVNELLLATMLADARAAGVCERAACAASRTVDHDGRDASGQVSRAA